MEVEDWTVSHDHTHIGRVHVLLHRDSIINEVIRLRIDLLEFSVRISEDTAEIIDFGPRYDLDEARSAISTADGSGCGDGPSDDELPDDSSVDETPPALQGMSDRVRKLSLKQLDIVQSLDTSPISDNDELEEGELAGDQNLAVIGSDVAVPVTEGFDDSAVNMLSDKATNLQNEVIILNQPLPRPTSGPTEISSHPPSFLWAS